MGARTTPAYRMISRNIHEYISHITCIPKYERCYYQDPAFFERKAKNGDRASLFARKRKIESKTRRQCVYTRYQEENVPRNTLGAETRMTRTRRNGKGRRGGRRQRQMQEFRKRSSCTLGFELSSLDSCVLILCLQPLPLLPSSAASFQPKEVIRVTKSPLPCVAGFLPAPFAVRRTVRAVPRRLREIGNSVRRDVHGIRVCQNGSRAREHRALTKLREYRANFKVAEATKASHDKLTQVTT